MPKVLISDAMDSIAEKILISNNIEVDVKTDFSIEEIIENIPMYDGLIVRSATKVTKEIMGVGRSSLVIVGMRLPFDSLFKQLSANQSLLDDSGIKTLNNIGDSNSPGAVVHAVYAGHMYANTFDSGIDNDPYDFKFEYPVIQ